jgi:methylmalonyl-CoA mutase
MQDQHKLNEFDPASLEAWRKLVERDLAGAAFEKKLVKRVAGVEIQPLFTRADLPAAAAGELPGFAPFTRGSYALGAVEMGWDVRQEIAHAEPARAAQAALENLNGGASSLLLTLDLAARALGEEHGREGCALLNLSELALALEHITLDKTPIALGAGASSFAYAAGLIALTEQRGVKASALAGSFGADPLGTLACHGRLPGTLDQAYDEAAELARWAHAQGGQVRALSADTSAYHEAGADAAQEIALALATGVEYLRALTARGLTLEAALGQLQFGFSVGRDFFLEIAKLRAARRTWARVASASGADGESGAMLIHARTSSRTKTRRDPWVNLLRGTAESFAAALGGADAITTHSFAAALGETDEFGQRMARNTQHLLRHESNLHRVVDPAGGSFYVEALTSALAEQAWAAFQAIEREGGLAQALRAGTVQERLGRVLAQERQAVETRKLAITGVNEFPHVKEEPVVLPRVDVLDLARRVAQAKAETPLPLPQFGPRAEPRASLLREGDRLPRAIAALREGASFLELSRALARDGEPASVKPLTRERLSEPFEALRERADQQLASSGRRPRVFLANLGPLAEHKARAGYAQNFFEAGGFEVLGNDGFASAQAAAQAFAQSGAELCALCSSDAIYAELAESSARALAENGAKVIVLAGNPGEREAAYRTAGISDFIHLGVNLVESLRALLSRAGVV